MILLRDEKMIMLKKKEEEVGFAMVVVLNILRKRRGALCLALNGRAVADLLPLILPAAAPPRRRFPTPI